MCAGQSQNYCKQVSTGSPCPRRTIEGQARLGAALSIERPTRRLAVAVEAGGGAGFARCTADRVTLGPSGRTSCAVLCPNYPDMGKGCVCRATESEMKQLLFHEPCGRVSGDLVVCFDFVVIGDGGTVVCPVLRDPLVHRTSGDIPSIRYRYRQIVERVYGPTGRVAKRGRARYRYPCGSRVGVGAQ